MSSAGHHRSFGSDFRRHFIAGLFVLMPIAFTVWVLHLVFTWLSDLGQPIVNSLIRSMSVTPRGVADAAHVARVQRMLEVFKDVISFMIVIVLIYLLGWATTKVVGRRALTIFDNVINRIPLAKGIYGTLKQLLSTFQSKPQGVERVVLVGYPSKDVRSVGLVTRTYKDETTGIEMASVYIPIAPFLTSGNVTVVPVDELMSTNWTVDEALKFVASGGSVSPISDK
jgi:uncharacterized membrane protein